MKLLIDADGCPVVDITVKIARTYKLDCLIICDTSHYFSKEGATTITVSKGPDSVDFALVNKVEKGDIVITQDYGLAALCLAKRAIPLSQNGLVFSDDNIDSLLLARHTAKKLRTQREKMGRQKKRIPAQNKEFERVLIDLIESGKEPSTD